MSVPAGSDFARLRRQILVVLLPHLILSIIGPVFLYRLASPYMSIPAALLLAGCLPLLSIGLGLLRRRLNPIGILSLLTIFLKIVLTFVLNDPRWILASVSLITGVHGLVMLASLLTRQPLLLWIVENMLAQSPTGRQLLQRLFATVSRSAWIMVTAVWGMALLLECGLEVLLALTLPVDLFVVISPLVRYGLFGMVLLGTLLFSWIRRSRKQRGLEDASHPLSQEISHPLPHVEKF